MDEMFVFRSASFLITNNNNEFDIVGKSASKKQLLRCLKIPNLSIYIYHVFFCFSASYFLKNFLIFFNSLLVYIFKSFKMARGNQREKAPESDAEIMRQKQQKALELKALESKAEKETNQSK
ncbi:unnamed protein product [Rhizophagus irregularis]|nr:unnamed protein product [Rhizophagus irregularis]